MTPSLLNFSREFKVNIVKNDKQLVCYLTGVGTYGRPGGLAHARLLERATNILDQAIAHNVSRSIMNAYTWLADRYHEGDKIFLFGFSRGAYQVRALAGMIHEVGLIIPGNKDQIPYAFKYYSAIKSGELKDISLAKDFKRTFSTSASVYFVGVWDTVSSIGINSLRNLPSANTCDHIRYFRQALALDELRVKFLPEYVCGGMGERSKSKPGLLPSHEHVKEVWFAGNHSDIGGARSGKAVSHLTLQDMPLLWMCEEVLAAGLLLNNSNIDFAYEDWRGHNIKNSLNVAWWLLEVLPIMHRHHGDNNHTFLPHLGRGRVIFPGQKLHASVLFRSNYQPKAVFWKSFMQWPEAIHFHFAYDQEQLGHAWEVPFKCSTAEAFIGTIHKEHTLNYVDCLAFMCSFELGVEAARKVNALETLEALLSIHGKTIADVKYAPDEKEETSPMSDPKNIDTDAAKEEHVNARKQRIHTRKQHINARKVCLSALVAYCVLIKNADEDTERILDSLDVPAMLQDTEYQGRACAALPALCEIKTLREKLLKEDMVGRIVDLCRNTGENKLIAMRTLSYLAQRFDDASLIISRHSDFIDTILIMLREKSPIVVVPALKILAAVAGNRNFGEVRGVALMKRLENLIKRREISVTPAAVAALCEICRKSPALRAEAIRRNILVTLINRFEFDKQGLSGGLRGLILLAESAYIRYDLAQGPHIGKLIAFSRDNTVEKSKEATEELKELSKYRELRERIIAEGGLDSIVDNLAKPDHALFAADALLTLMEYDDAKEQILLNTKVDLRLLQMIDERIFDGTIHRKGIDILADIFKNDDLRSVMLYPMNPPSFDNGSWNFGCKDAPHQRLKKAAKYVMEKTFRRQVKNAKDDSDGPKYATNVIGILRKMIETYPLDSVQNSAINYLRIIADYEDARRAMVGAEIIGPLLWCLKATDVDIEALNDVLRKIAPDESLRREITKDDKILVEMLSSHYPGEVLRMTAALESLSSHGEIRQKVREMDEYQHLKRDPLYYLDPRHRPHEHDQYAIASQAITSIIGILDRYDTSDRTTDPLSYLDPYEYPDEIDQYMI